MRPRRLAAVAAALVTGVACGPARSLDVDRLEESLGDTVVEDYSVFATDVRCPRDVEAKEGNTFSCVVVLEGDLEVTYRVEQLDGSGGLRFQAEQAVIDPVTPAATIASHYASKVGKNVDVDCGDAALIVQAPGDTFTCTATDRAGTADVVSVEVIDLAGSFRATVGDETVERIVEPEPAAGGEGDEAGEG